MYYCFGDLYQHAFYVIMFLIISQNERVLLRKPESSTCFVLGTCHIRKGGLIVISHSTVTDRRRVVQGHLHTRAHLSTFILTRAPGSSKVTERKQVNENMRIVQFHICYQQSLLIFSECSDIYIGHAHKHTGNKNQFIQFGTFM